jgi:hypothetical protein
MEVPMMKVLFCEIKLFEDKKRKIFDHAMTTLVHYFLFRGIALGGSVL